MYNASMSEKLNVKNRTIFTDRRGFFTAAGKPRKSDAIKKVVDNLHFLRGMNSECVDLIYLDPPFNSKRQYRAPLGEGKAAVFDDTWRMDMVKAEWQNRIAVHNPPLAKLLDAAADAGHHSDRPYLIYMAVRLLEMRRVLKKSGSIYLHCDPTMSHWLKLLMDCIFGVGNFRNEIVWCYASTSPARKDFPRKHDILLRYSKTRDYVFNADSVRVPYKLEKMPERKNYPNRNRGGSGEWKGAPHEELGKRHAAGKVPEDWWEITFGPNSPERTGYKTQKPLALLERIIAASSNKGDIVLDPFCGCATACIAAEKLGRKWIGMDVSPVAFDMVKSRLLKDLKIAVKNSRQSGENEILRLQVRQNGSVDKGEAHHRVIPPQRSDGVKLNLTGQGRIDARDRLFRIQQYGHCNGCAVCFDMPNLTIDHITPKAFGGLDLPTNLQLLCFGCNTAKGTKTMDEFIALRRKFGSPCRNIPEKEYQEKEVWEMNMEKGKDDLL